MKRFALLFTWLAVGAVTATAAGQIFHVAPAPRGHDAHDGSAAAPFATVERARQAVRAQRATSSQAGDFVVELAPGTYELAAPLRLEPEDSGANGFAVVYRAAAGGPVVLSGGRRIAGWTDEGGGAWRAAVGRDVDFRQLWTGGRRAVRARTPNAGQMLRLGAEKQADGFDLPESLVAGVTLRPAEVEMSVLIAWMHKRLRIARLAPAESAGQVRAVIEPGEWDGITKQPQGDRVYLNRSYWLENAPEFLDAPGEFYLDRAAGVLRYRPRPDESPAQMEIVRPELEQLVVLAGRPGAPVHDVRFEGLTFAFTGWTRPNRHGFVDVQANSLVPADLAAAVDGQYRHQQRKDRVPAALQASTADRITVRGCRFVHLGGTGVMFTGGGDDNVIEGNAFFDLAAGGIEFGEDAARPVEARLFPRRNRIANNFLAHVGQDYFGSVAILGYYTDGSVITHNEIANIPYTAVSQGWGWGNPPAPADSRGNRITHNVVTNYMRRLDDGGGLYTTDRLLGSEIAHNVVARMLPPDTHTKAGGALYLDQFTEGVHVHDNMVTEAIRWLFIWNPNIRGNRVEANYADTDAWRNDGKDNVVEPARKFEAAEAAAAVARIRAEAGIEPTFAGARAFAAGAEIVVDTTGADFQILGGAWAVAEPAGRWAATVRRTTEPGAAARWLPLVPVDGDYELSLWRGAGAPVGQGIVRHARGEALVAIPAATTSGWVSLGRFPLRAGAGTEVEIRRREAGGLAPLEVDALRLRAVPE